MTLHEELEALVEALARDRIDYALVGGLALAVWGAPRATKDIDILVLPGDVDRAKATAATCGFTLGAEPMEFRDGMVVHRVNKIRAGEVVTLDLLVVSDGLRPYWQAREARALAHVPLWVISREGLIAMKLAAGRPQDEADVVRLKEMDR